MLSYLRVQEIVREYQAKYDLINSSVPEVMAANQNPASNVGALIDAQSDLNWDLAADLIRKLNKEPTGECNPLQSAQGRSFGFSSK